MALATLCENGSVFRWTRSPVGGHWRCEKTAETNLTERQVQGAPDVPVALAHARDRIAAAFGRSGVRIWVLSDKGHWQVRRPIIRQNVSAIRFVEDGAAILGGTKDGVLWYSQVQGLMRACAFFKSEVRDIDVSSDGQHALVSQADGCAALVRIAGDNQGKVERLFTVKDPGLEGPAAPMFGFGARFGLARDNRVLWGSSQGFALVWDISQGGIDRALDHGGERDVVQAIATCRTPKAGIDSCLITGTQDGMLMWWTETSVAAEPWAYRSPKRIKT